jgi:hypothetical protein
MVHGAISHQKGANLKAENEPKCVAGSSFALASRGLLFAKVKIAPELRSIGL